MMESHRIPQYTYVPIQLPKYSSAIWGYKLLSLIMLIFMVLLEIVFLPVVIFILANSVKGWANPLDFFLMLLLLIGKYSLIGVSIYGVFFTVGKMKEPLVGVFIIIFTIIVLMMVSWIVLLIAHGATAIIVLTDPIVYDLLFTILLSIPSFLEVLLDQ